MKYLFQLLFRKLKSNYFYPEIKQVSRIISTVVAAWALYTYGSWLLGLAVSPTGMTYIAFFMVAIVLGQVIRLYYRIMVIKYSEKDTRIELFEVLHKQA